MKFFKKVLLFILDSLGVGEMPDAHSYDDSGSNTIGNISKNYPLLKLPNFSLLGLGNIIHLKGIPKTSTPFGHYGKMLELSAGKDTTTGHWEIAGILLKEPFRTFHQGFPEEIIEKFKMETGFDVLGNKRASGTEIIKELGEEHQRTGKLIVYTSADSVFQIAAHEEVVPLKILYEVCKKTRKILDPYRVARVIARPFLGDGGNYKRTYNRKDFSIPPPEKTLLNHLCDAKINVIGIGKIKNIFADEGVNISIDAEGNKDTLEKTIKALKTYKDGLIFVNLVDFDMLWGHRRDVEGYAKGLMEVDCYLPKILEACGDDTLFIITADHGCDPTFTRHTDHTREYVPLLIYHSSIGCGHSLGIRKGFFDIAQTIAQNFNIAPLKNGKIIKV